MVLLADVVHAFAVVLGEFVVVGDFAIVVFEVVIGGRVDAAFWKWAPVREFSSWASRLLVDTFSSRAVCNDLVPRTPRAKVATTGAAIAPAMTIFLMKSRRPDWSTDGAPSVRLSMF